jgi:predicted GH43/DUF377 family glycosyl hydrolase
MALSKINPKTCEVVKSIDLNYKADGVEKNWTPFVYRNKKGKDEIHFVYYFLPHRILKLSQTFDGTAAVAYKNTASIKKMKNWQEKWGLIRGGTPAIKLDDEYICFFHSVFVANNVRFYVFAALTFEASPPFRIKKISKTPIFFRDIYSTNPNYLRTIFPSGIVQGREAGREVFYVVCGENDAAIKCVVIDKNCLLNSLDPVEIE